MKKQSKPVNEWEKKFDKEFGYEPYISGPDAGEYFMDGVDSNKIKDFIHSLLSQQRAEMVEEIKKWLSKETLIGGPSKTNIFDDRVWIPINELLNYLNKIK